MLSSLKWIAPVVVISSLVLASSPAVSSTSFAVSNNGITSYRIDGMTNPTLQLTRGQQYDFNINAPGHPFWIKTIASTGVGNAFSTGVTGNGTDLGTLTFVVPMSAPATLHYSCQIHASMTGTLSISDPVPVQPNTWGQIKHRYLD